MKVPVGGEREGLGLPSGHHSWPWKERSELYCYVSQAKAPTDVGR